MKFTAYIDDSGSDPSQSVANATALIVPDLRVFALEREWENLKKREHFADFHTSVFVARNPRSEFADWDDHKQRRVFTRVRQIIKRFGVKVVSFTVHKKDYDEVVPSALRKYAGKYHYTWAMRHLVSQIVAWRIVSGALPLKYVFDWMTEREPHRIEIETVMKQGEKVANELGVIGECTNYSFRHRKDVAGLQCVDLLAWTCYQYGLLAHRKKLLPEFADVAWKDSPLTGAVDQR